jgi:chaperonin GroEL (HSP60 family)
MRLRQYAATVKGKEQMAVEAYASAMEIVPRALANNAGLNPIDMTVALKNKHNGKAGVSYGLNVYEGKAIDMLKAGVVEPLRIKTQAIKSATEAACMVLRIDDILAMAQVKNPAGAPGGM